MSKKPKAASPALTLVEGTVVRTTGSSHRVQTPAGELIDCVVRGKFRLEGLNTTNPVAVGDRVRLSPPADAHEPGVIREILPRQNYLLRKAISHARRVHILAANLDQALLIFTLKEPQTAPGFANRFLVVAEAFHIPARILINKTDLLHTEAELARWREMEAVYQQAGYQVTSLSALDPDAGEKVAALLQDKISFVGGHSGSGKSTLINLIAPELDLKTGEISASNQKGRHTTTYAQMYPLPGGGAIIDSPGIKEFGLAHFKKEELSHYFPEMRRLLAGCRFHNCTHVAEPGCAVKAALETGGVHPTRYDTYLRLMEEVDGERSY